MGKLLIITGTILIIAGLLITYGIKIPFGQLPGDFRYKSENFSIYLPLTSSLIVSLLLSLLFFLYQKLR